MPTTALTVPPPGPVLDTFRSLAAEVSRFVASVEVDHLSPVDAQALVPELARVERRVAALGALCAARAAASVRRSGRGREAAEWLAKATGRTTRDAERTLAVAERAGRAPGTRRAWLDGKLTCGQAAQIAKADEFCPGAERELLELAERGTAEDLRKQAEAVVRDNRNEGEGERHARHHRNRRLSTWTDDDGAFQGRFCATTVQGATVRSMLELCAEAVFRRDRREGRHSSAAARRMDALELMARLAEGVHPFDLGYQLRDLPAALRPLDDDDAPGVPADPAADEPDPASGEPAGSDPSTAGVGSSEGSATGPPRPTGRLYRPRGAGPPTALVRIDLPALRRGHAEPGETCDIPGVGPIPVAHAREILGDALLRFVITDGHDVRTVAHLSRRASAHQRTALLYRHDECAVAGCTTRLALQHDHDDPWAATHETWLPNLKAVCPHHHRRKTDDGWDWVVEPPDPLTGKHRLVPRHHPEHPTNTGAVKPSAPQRTARPVPDGRHPDKRPPRGAASQQLPLDDGTTVTTQTGPTDRAHRRSGTTRPRSP